MEGNTYSATWKLKGGKYYVFLEDDQKVKGVDIDFETASEELCLNICEKFGDGEAVLKFSRQPPVPSGVSRYANPAIVTLGWNESIGGPKWQDKLFEGGYCKACRVGLGERTHTPLELSSLPRGLIGSFDQIMYSPVLLSQELLDCFSDAEKDRLGLIPTLVSKKTDRKFYEVNGGPLLKQVGVKGVNYDTLASWECGVCGHKSFSCSHPEMPDSFEYTNFCAKSDLPEEIDSAFVIQDNVGRKMVCMSLKHWKKINKIKKLKGVLADRLFVLPDEQIERDPAVRIEAQAN